MTRTFEIKFRLPTGNSGTQVMHITASDAGTARKIFQQQNPGCQISMVSEAKR